MKRFRQLVSIISKYLFPLRIVLVVLLSCSTIATAYLYGSTKNSTHIQANLMQVDNEVKKQKNSNFLHGELNFEEKLTNKQKFDKSMDILKRSLYRNKFFNAYMVSSKDGEQRIFQAYTGLDNLVWNDFSVVMVRNFWDYKMMESIPLPLFRQFEGGGRNGIRPTNDDAMFGSYISSRTAYDFVASNGMLEHNNGDVVAAFNELLDNSAYYFSINSKQTPLNRDVTFSINNIYLTEEYAYLMDKETKHLESKSYRDYFKVFTYWNDQSLITYSYEVFYQGFNFTYDIAGSYFNYDYFIRNILSPEYSDNGLSLRFIGENADLEKYSADVNKYSVKKDNNNLLYLVASIVFFALLIFVYVSLFTKIKTNKTKILRVLLFTLPILPFVLVQIIFHLALLFGSSFSGLYLVLNSTGNTVIILYMLIGLMYSLMWGVIDDEKDSKSH